MVRDLGNSPYDPNKRWTIAPEKVSSPDHPQTEERGIP
jgi:hypothetical protein